MKNSITRRQFTLGSLAALATSSPLVPPVVAEQGGASTRSISELYTEADATALAEQVKKGNVSALELLDEAIRRVELLNPKLNAVVLKHYDYARDYLRKNGSPQGYFGGVPFLLKDLGIQLAGTQTTGASRLLNGITAQHDDVLVQRQKEAGLVIFGKTNTPEFGLALTTESYLHGACRNPWNLQHSTGGSSGGAAAAVAAGIVPMAHATDGGGSIRVPASACGIFGFKPTRALTPRSAGPSMMSVSHVVTRSVRDSAAMLDVTAGYSPGLPFVSPEPVGGYLQAMRSVPRKLRIAMVLDEPPLALHKDIEAAIGKTAKALEQAGHVVDTASPGIDFDKLNAAQNTLLGAEFARGMKRLSSAIDRPLSDETLEELSLTLVAEGAATTAEQYLDAWHHIQAVTQQMAAFQQQWDIILSPVTVTPAPRLGDITERPGDTVLSYTERFRTYSAYTPLQNLTGVPAASVPVGLSSEGLPVAAMLSAAIGQDALLMSLCGQLEQAMPFFRGRPSLS